MRVIAPLSLLVSLYGSTLAADSSNSTPIQYRGRDAELTLNALGDRTLQIVLAAIDEADGKVQKSPASSVLVELEPRLLLRSRSLESGSELVLGNLRIRVTTKPLTVSIRTATERAVQQIVLDAHSDGKILFRAAAPVLGMGEGARQFDRRGAEYTMKDGWGAWERPTYGSWVAVPFLIGSDGWALFVHHPLGQFDLRGPDASFTPWEDQVDSPLDLYIIAWDEPADVFKEYARLVGQTPLPPKWALGFMQSHRTLTGPDEVLQVAKTYRDKKHPCDALIYLGTGYCPAGWNTGGTCQPRVQPEDIRQTGGNDRPASRLEFQSRPPSECSAAKANRRRRHSTR
jgi:alpha-glucosidase/alpha-D-xyloside xylohydrolase